MKKILLLIIAFGFTAMADSSSFSGGTKEADRKLASGDDQADVEHYQKQKRRFGIDIGMTIPFEDFTSFEKAQALGLHFIWEAIPPFGFTVAMLRASGAFKGTPGAGKISTTAFMIGTQASFPVNRFKPFIKINGVFFFNDVSFGATRAVTAGLNTLLTTVGLSAGVGFDFVVGREVSIGLDASYYYPIPKTVTTNGGDFNLGSPFALIALRLNF